MQYRQRQLNVLSLQHLQSVLFICCLGLLLAGCPEDAASTNCSTHPENCGALEDAEPARLYVDPPFGLGFGCFGSWLLGCFGTLGFLSL